MGIAQFDAGYPSKAAKSFEMCEGVYCLMNGKNSALQDEVVGNDLDSGLGTNFEDHMILNMNSLNLDFVLRRFKVQANRRICKEAAGRVSREPTKNLSGWKIHRIPSDVLLEAPALASISNSYSQTADPRVLNTRLGSYRVMSARYTGFRDGGKASAHPGQQVEIADPHAEIGTSQNCQHEDGSDPAMVEQMGEIEPSRKLSDKIERLTWDVEKCLTTNEIERGSMDSSSKETVKPAHAEPAEQVETFFSDESPTTPSEDERKPSCVSDVPSIPPKSEARLLPRDSGPDSQVEPMDVKCRPTGSKEGRPDTPRRVKIEQHSSFAETSRSSVNGKDRHRVKWSTTI